MRTRPTASPRWTLAHAQLLLTAVVLALYLMTMAGGQFHIDTYTSNLGSWRIAGTGTPWLEHVQRDFPASWWHRLWISTTPSGHLAAYRSPGVIAVAVPAYVLSGATASASTFSTLPGNLTAAVLTAGTVLMLMAALRGLVSPALNLLTGAVVGLTTPYWSISANMLWTHSLTDFALAGIAWSARRDRWWLVGVFGGVGLWGRFHVALIVAVVGLGIAWLRRSPRIAIVVGSIGVLFTAAACLWDHWMYQTWSPLGGYGTPGQYASTVGHDSALHHVSNELGLLFALDRGLFVWTPVLALLLPAVVRGWRAAPDWTRVLAIGGVAYLFAQGLIDVFDGGDAFYGYRLGLETLTCLVPLYAVTAHRAGRLARALAPAVLGLQLAAFAIGGATTRFYVPKSHAWTRNALWHALHEFPALWGFLGICVLLAYGIAMAVRDVGRRTAAA